MVGDVGKCSLTLMARKRWGNHQHELFIQSLRRLIEQDQLFFKLMVGARLKRLAKAGSTLALAEFCEVGRVSLTASEGMSNAAS